MGNDNTPIFTWPKGKICGTPPRALIGRSRCSSQGRGILGGTSDLGHDFLGHNNKFEKDLFKIGEEETHHFMLL